MKPIRHTFFYLIISLLVPIFIQISCSASPRSDLDDDLEDADPAPTAPDENDPHITPPSNLEIQTEFYPTIVVHGIRADPYHMEGLIDKIKGDRPVYYVYAGDTDEYSDEEFSPISIWSFGYYKEQSEDSNSHGNSNFMASHAGRMGGTPILTGHSYYDDRVAYASLLGRAVDNILRATGSSKVNIVAHSLGGVVSRAYITWLGGAEKVHKFLSVGSPHHGFHSAQVSAFSMICELLSFPSWMIDGELFELDTSANYFESLSYIAMLDRDWNDVRDQIEYATISGDHFFPALSPLLEGPDDGFIQRNSSQLSGAVFNSVVPKAHSQFYAGDEMTLSHSTYTAEVVKRWVFRNQVNIGGEFPRYGSNAFSPYPTPFNNRFLLQYELTGGDAVSVDIHMSDITGGSYGPWFFPLYEGVHDIHIDTTGMDLANSTYILTVKAYDMSGEFFTERVRIIRLCCSSGDAPAPIIANILTHPALVTSDRSAEFSFSANQSGVSFSYRLDDGPWSDFSSVNTASFFGLSYGLHSFHVSARKDHFYSGEPAVFTWIVRDDSEVPIEDEPEVPIEDEPEIPPEVPPCEEWSRNFGGTLRDTAHSVQQTRDGGFILAGKTNDNNSGSSDALLIKTDRLGNEEWSRTFVEVEDNYNQIHSVQQTIDGGYILAGWVGSLGAWLIKTNSSGTEEWSQTFGGGYSTSIQQTTDGGYILSTSDGQLIKTNTSGDIIWAESINLHGEVHAEVVQQTQDGDYVVAGYFNSPTFSDADDAFVIKTNNTGDTAIWQLIYGGPGNPGDQRAQDIKKTEDGGYIVGGITFSNDAWIMKISSSADSEWTQNFVGRSFNQVGSVQQTSDGGYMLAGYTTTYAARDEDTWIIKYDSSGSEEWIRTLVGSEYNGIHSAQQTSDEGYILAGYTGPDDNSDVWLLKICGETDGPSDEVCDGRDNDGDGLIDEDLEQTTCGLGVCEHTINNCAEGEIQSCDRWEGASEEICDGLDNDCDGITDEGITDIINGTDTGACQPQIQRCQGGSFVVIQSRIGPAAEILNGIDDNCNGEVDEGLDQDGDGIIDSLDNCPSVANPDQADNENDNIGDVCDPDDDNDNIPDETDPHPFIANRPPVLDPVEDMTMNETDSVWIQLVATDPDEGSLTYGISRRSSSGTRYPGGIFSEDTGLYRWWIGNHRGPSTYPITFTVSDGYLTDTITVNITVNDSHCEDEDVGEPPTPRDNVGDPCNHDEDNDGDPDTTDCAPLNPAIHHGVAEVCDGVDNNCDAEMDEVFDVGDACSDGVGACEESGVKVCTADMTTTECNAVAGTPSAETCDGVDNDCDGEVDEGLDRDGDEVVDCLDACPDDPNDPLGDPCNHNEDGDEILDTADNCPFESNPDQYDIDRDGVGDVCDDENSCAVYIYKNRALPDRILDDGTHRRDGEYKIVLLNCEPEDSYDCTIYHHTNIDYDQNGGFIVTDTDGNGEIELNSYDYYSAPDNSYNFAVCESHTSNRIYNTRTQVTQLSVNYDSPIHQEFYTLSGNKNSGANIILNGAEVVSHNSSTSWSYEVALDEGDNLIELISEMNDSHNTNVGVIYFTINYSPDDDDDGVDDSSDACPSTPAGEIADAEGCSCSQIELTERNCPDDICNGDNWEDYPDDGADTCVDGVVTEYSCGLISSVPSTDCDLDDDGDGDPDTTDCAPLDPTVYHGAAEVCDGVDNNCVGGVDEGLGQTTCGLGICENTIDNCVGGITQTCTPLATTSEEICDGLDNDCDGTTDEDIADIVTGSDIGECQSEIQRCQSGRFEVIQMAIDPTDEICDGLDNNCDGITDGVYNKDENIRITNDTAFSVAPSIAWTGEEFALSWFDDRYGTSDTFVTRLDRAGNKLVEDIRVIEGDPRAGPSYSPKIVWNGNSYGIINLNGTEELIFVSMDELRTAETPVSSVRNRIRNHNDFIWDGEVYNVAWDRHGGQIFFTHLDLDGSTLGEIRADTSDLSSVNPSIASNGEEYCLCWQDVRDDDWEIYCRIFDNDGPLSDEIRITDSVGTSYFPSVQWADGEYGVTWVDDRTGVYGIYFTRLSADGTKLMPEVRVTDSYLGKSFVWNNGEYGLTWKDGGHDVYFATFSQYGNLSNGPYRITDGRFVVGGSAPDIINTAEHNYAVSWSMRHGGSNYEIYFTQIEVCEDPCELGERQNFYHGDPTTEGIGNCQSQILECQDTDHGRRFVTIQDEILPSEDVCDGLDNDCDGEIDEEGLDQDGDGIAGCEDSCPNDPENDIDGDGVCGDIDSCPEVSNIAINIALNLDATGYPSPLETDTGYSPSESQEWYLIDGVTNPEGYWEGVAFTYEESSWWQEHQHITVDFGVERSFYQVEVWDRQGGPNLWYECRNKEVEYWNGSEWVGIAGGYWRLQEVSSHENPIIYSFSPVVGTKVRFSCVPENWIWVSEVVVWNATSDCL